MKILAISDTHNDVSLIQRTAEQAEKEDVDLVILAGDITHFSNDTENIIGPFLERKRRVIFIPGNHEDDATADFLAEFYNVTNLHGKGIVYDGIGFFGCGKGNIPINMITEEEASKTLAKAHEEVKNAKVKVMVSHVHPSGTDMETLSTIVPGSESVRQAIEEFKPDIVFCGHVHEAAGLEEKIGNTRVINVAKKARIIEI